MLLFPGEDPLSPCPAHFAFNGASGCFVAKKAKGGKSTFLSTYCVPSAGSGTLYILCHLILIITLWSRSFLYFADEKIDGQREGITWTPAKWRVQIETQVM